MHLNIRNTPMRINLERYTLYHRFACCKLMDLYREHLAENEKTIRLEHLYRFGNI
jgi:hypothetical protein